MDAQDSAVTYVERRGTSDTLAPRGGLGVGESCSVPLSTALCNLSLTNPLLSHQYSSTRKMPSFKQKLKQTKDKILSPFRSHSKGRAPSAPATPRISADAPLVEGAGPTGAGGTSMPPLRGRSPSARYDPDTSPRGGVGPTDHADVIEDLEASGGSVSLQDVAKIVAEVAGTVSEFSDAFPPLKTVAIGLKLIFERVEVCLP